MARSVTIGEKSYTADGPVKSKPITVVGLAMDGLRNVETFDAQQQPGGAAHMGDLAKLRVTVVRDGMRLVTYPGGWFTWSEAATLGNTAQHAHRTAEWETLDPDGDTSPGVSVDIDVQYVFDITNRNKPQNNATDKATVTLAPGETYKTIVLDRVDPHREAYVFISLGNARFTEASPQELRVGITGVCAPDKSFPNDLPQDATPQPAQEEDLPTGPRWLDTWDSGDDGLIVARAACIAFLWYNSSFWDDTNES
ncbi:hypothetical protein ACGFX2_32850 [Streptomyces goshikiensis]|uniref:hypothetical protein n=1 Tax=Streptomyces goshikiensis TaxID=1942 RepID=UPI00371F87CC